MENNKLGQEPAFPEQTWECDGRGNVLNFQNPGMSKRFYAACAAMQGLISTSNTFKVDGKEVITPEQLIKLSFIYADELLRQENL